MRVCVEDVQYVVASCLLPIGRCCGSKHPKNGSKKWQWTAPRTASSNAIEDWCSSFCRGCSRRHSVKASQLSQKHSTKNVFDGSTKFDGLPHFSESLWPGPEGTIGSVGVSSLTNEWTEARF
jgi:hypothetical protein